MWTLPLIGRVVGLSFLNAVVDHKQLKSGQFPESEEHGTHRLVR